MSIRSLTLAAALSTAIAGSALAGANWTGFYIGLQGGYADHNGAQFELDFPALTVDSVEELPISGAVGGIHAGYNHQMGEWVIGVEGDIEFSDISGWHDFGGGDDAVFEEIDWLGSIRARLGYTDGAIMIYATGGLAVGSTDMLVTEGIPVVDSLSGDDTPWGYTVGGGVEVAFSPKWSGRIEYRWTDLDDTLVAGNIYSGDFAYSFENEISTVRVGVTYHTN